MQPELIKSHYQMVWSENCETIGDFNKLLNWIGGEFTLYLQQDEKSGLKVFFPNGWFFINLIEGMGNEYEIIVKSKSKKTIVPIYNRIISVVNHLNKFTGTLPVVAL